MSVLANQGSLLNRVSMAQYTVAAFFVLLRSAPAVTSSFTDNQLTRIFSFVARGYVVKKFGLDDLFIVIAIVGSTVFMPDWAC